MPKAPEQEARAPADNLPDYLGLSIEPDDFSYALFVQRGGPGKAHQVFGPELASLLDELNEVLAA